MTKKYKVLCDGYLIMCDYVSQGFVSEAEEAGYTCIPMNEGGDE